jgi:branched-chain amino acid transport system substrate-binding protein
VVDVGFADTIVTRGLRNTFRFGPGFGKVTAGALDNLVALNDAAGKPARTVVVVHEDGLFGSGMARLMQAELPKRGFEVLETISHPTPARDMSNIALRIRALNPDLIIPSSYYAEFVLLSQTLQQRRIRPKGIYCVLNGAASNFRFVREFPQPANLVMDVNHWADPRKPRTAELRRQVESQNRFWLYNTPLNYSAVMLVADALERAGRADRGAVIEALARTDGNFTRHIMPYGPTRFVNGQNQAGAPVNTQVQNGDIKVIFPRDFADAQPVYPVTG